MESKLRNIVQQNQGVEESSQIRINIVKFPFRSRMKIGRVQSRLLEEMIVQHVDDRLKLQVDCADCLGITDDSIVYDFTVWEVAYWIGERRRR